MRAVIKFKEDSPYRGITEKVNSLMEIHYNYDGSAMVAFECKCTGGTYEIKHIEEIEIFN